LDDCTDGDLVDWYVSWRVVGWRLQSSRSQRRNWSRLLWRTDWLFLGTGATLKSSASRLLPLHHQPGKLFSMETSTILRVTASYVDANALDATLLYMLKYSF
jgi:hypothetical protein